MITKVEVERFKSIEKVTLELGKINVLVGPNNAGKSSIIQALQLATSVAQASRIYAPKAQYDRSSGIKSTSIAQEQLIYAPSKDVYALGYRNGSLSQEKEKGIKVSFFEEDLETDVIICKGRNKNIAVTISGEKIGNKMESLNQPYCMYVTGLAGIPFQEEARVVGAVRRSAAKGDSNTVFRNVLYLLSQAPEKWQEFMHNLKTVFPGIQIRVQVEPEVDGIIDVSFSLENDGIYYPIDLAGTGILQSIQISAYINYFEPKLLLLDEPDSHLHPNNQKTLVNLLLDIIETRDIRIMISTHSRHIMAALKNDAKFFLVKNGSVVNSEYSHYIGLLELGALDSFEQLETGALKFAILTEDSKFEHVKMMQCVLKASGYKESEYAIFTYDTISKIDSAKMFACFLTNFSRNTRVIVHRDRDGLLPRELREAKCDYDGIDRVYLFITLRNDMEMYFCDPSHIRAVCAINGFEISIDEAKRLFETAATELIQKSHDKACNNFIERQKSRRDTNYANSVREFEEIFAKHRDLFLYGKGMRGIIAASLQQQFKRNIDLIIDSEFVSDPVLIDILERANACESAPS